MVKQIIRTIPLCIATATMRYVVSTRTFSNFRRDTGARRGSCLAYMVNHGRIDRARFRLQTMLLFHLDRMVAPSSDKSRNRSQIGMWPDRHVPRSAATVDGEWWEKITIRRSCMVRLQCANEDERRAKLARYGPGTVILRKHISVRVPVPRTSLQTS